MFLTNVLRRVLRRSISPRRQQTHRKPARQGRSFVPRLEFLEDRTVLSTLTVTSVADSGAGSLRAVLGAAHGGDTIRFDHHLTGQTITLTSGELVIDKSLAIDGPGADRLTVSGHDASRVFDITASGAHVTISGLTIAHGMATQGGGIDNAGTLSVADVVLADNQAVGSTGNDGDGGAIFNEMGATLAVTHARFLHNHAVGGAPDATGNAGNALGGAIANFGGSATIGHSTFTDNQAVGDDSGTGDHSSPGTGPTPDVIHSTGAGGAIANEEGGTLLITGSTLADNLVRGGLRATSTFGVGFGNGGAIHNSATLTVRHTSFTGNQAIGADGISGVSGGNGSGGAIVNGFLGNASVSDSTFTGNQATGGAGGVGGAAAAKSRSSLRTTVNSQPRNDPLAGS
jgi:hypothetical protein